MSHEEKIAHDLAKERSMGRSDYHVYRINVGPGRYYASDMWCGKEQHQIVASYHKGQLLETPAVQEAPVVSAKQDAILELQSYIEEMEGDLHIELLLVDSGSIQLNQDRVTMYINSIAKAKVDLTQLKEEGY